MPGRGWAIHEALDGSHVAVINLQGRTYMQPIDNPFTEADRLIDEGSEPLPPIRLVDFHCEITSEKNALGLYLDGRVSVVVGTHTHVVTGDERILPGGTAYQTDLGMTGPIHSVIGFKPDDRPAPVHQRPADALRGGRGAGRLQRLPGRHRPGHRPGPRDRADPAARSRSEHEHAVHGSPRATPPGSGHPGRPVAGRPPHPHAALGRHRSNRATSSQQAAAAGVRLLAITDHDDLAAYRELTAAGAPALPSGLELLPGRRDQLPDRRRSPSSGRASCTSSGFGDPAGRRRPSRTLLARQRQGRRIRFDRTLGDPAQSWGCRWTRPPSGSTWA